MDPHDLTALVARAYRIVDLISVANGKRSVADWTPHERTVLELGIRAGIRARSDALAEQGVIGYEFD